jgi:hypothetical protein
MIRLFDLSEVVWPGGRLFLPIFDLSEVIHNFDTFALDAAILGLYDQTENRCPGRTRFSTRQYFPAYREELT